MQMANTSCTLVESPCRGGLPGCGSTPPRDSSCGRLSKITRRFADCRRLRFSSWRAERNSCEEFDGSGVSPTSPKPEIAHALGTNRSILPNTNPFRAPHSAPCTLSLSPCAVPRLSPSRPLVSTFPTLRETRELSFCRCRTDLFHFGLSSSSDTSRSAIGRYGRLVGDLLSELQVLAPASDSSHVSPTAHHGPPPATRHLSRRGDQDFHESHPRFCPIPSLVSQPPTSTWSDVRHPRAGSDSHLRRVCTFTRLLVVHGKTVPDRLQDPVVKGDPCRTLEGPLDAKVPLPTAARGSSPETSLY